MRGIEAELERFIKPLQADIFRFSDAMGLDPTHQQAEILRAVQAGHPRIAAKSGNGIGKTTATCIAGGWRTIQAKNALTVVTAPTMDQCRGVWLTEFGRILEGRCRYPILKQIFQVSKSDITIFGHSKWAIRFRTATAAEAFQGIHEDNLTIISEEGSGIRPEIMQAIDGNLTNKNAMHLSVGNPNTRQCRFFDFFNKDRARWHCMTFSSEDSPLTSRESIQHIIDTYGKDSDVYRVRVLGEFPNMDPNCIISMETLEKCLKTPLMLSVRQPRKHRGKLAPAKQYGIDYARFGDDESVIVERFGNAVRSLEFYSHEEPRRINRLAMKKQAINEWTNEETVFCADANGMGDGVMIDFKEAGRYVHEFKAQHKARKRGEFANKITEAWFNFAKLCQTGTVLLPNDPILLQQLSTRMYKINPKGLIQLETKDDYKLRTESGSPDRADAVCMAFYDDVEADTQIITPNMLEAKRFGIGTRFGAA